MYEADNFMLLASHTGQKSRERNQMVVCEHVMCVCIPVSPVDKHLNTLQKDCITISNLFFSW